MSSVSLETLKKGFEVLEKQIQKQKAPLQAALAKGQPISSEDENWLDNEEAWCMCSDEVELNILKDEEVVIVQRWWAKCSKQEAQTCIF